jgi:tetratricopeptide (TPR) repeat protein
VFGRILSVRELEIPLSPWWRTALLIAATAAGIALLLATVSPVIISASLESSTNMAALERAARLDPANPEIQLRLGLFAPYSLDPAVGPVNGLGHLRRTVSLTPFRAQYWSSLGAACESLGDLSCAEAADRQALRLAPMTPRVYWQAANFYIRTYRNDLAVPLLRRLLEMDPQYDRPVFQIAYAVLGDANAVWEQVIPPGADSQQRMDFVNLLVDQEHPDVAQQLWKRVAERDQKISFAQVQPYLERLISRGRLEQAYSAWLELKRQGAVRDPSKRSDNLVFNGGFEQSPLPAPSFDWNSASQPYVTADFANTNCYEGAHCLRLDFPVARNAEFEPVYQIIPVEPGQNYELNAKVRSEGLTSTSGPRLRVVDSGHGELFDVATDAVTGTAPWHDLHLTFRMGLQTHFVRLSIWRPRAREFPTDIQGSFWIDDIELKPSLAETPRVAAGKLNAN